MQCPYCKEVIAEGAIKCKHCGSVLSEGTPYAPETPVAKMPAGKFNAMAFLFNSSYYAGYGKTGKAMLCAAIGFIPLTAIPVSIYLAFSANKELPIGQTPFHWGKAVGVGIFQVMLSLAVVSAVKS